MYTGGILLFNKKQMFISDILFKSIEVYIDVQRKLIRFNEAKSNLIIFYQMDKKLLNNR